MMDFIMSVWNWVLSLFGISPYHPPSGGAWRCSMFFPHQLCGTGKRPPWGGNSGVDSSLEYAMCHGEANEVERRQNMYAWQKAMGSDTMLFIAERLYGHDVPHLELQMFLCNMKHPQDGHQMNDRENEVVKARAYGVRRWIVDLFNDDTSSIKPAQFEDYIKQMAGCYSWATPDEVAFMVCLESNERFSVAQVKNICGLIRQYAPGKRIIVGSADPGFLSACSGNGVELWLETAWHPFQTNMGNADKYLASVRGLLSKGPTWCGEYGNGQDPSVSYISKKALEMGCVGVGSYKQ